MVYKPIKSALLFLKYMFSWMFIPNQSLFSLVIVLKPTDIDFNNFFDKMVYKPIKSALLFLKYMFSWMFIPNQSLFSLVIVLKPTDID
jgi:hypothetical protein